MEPTLYGTKGVFQPWRVLKHEHSLSNPAPGLGAPAQFNAMPHVSFRVLRINREDVLVKCGDAPWKHWGWQYSAVGKFIIDVAYQCEMQRTGSSKSLIEAFRDECQKASTVPDNTRLTITRNGDGVSSWHQESFDKIAQELGINAGQPVTEFACTFEEVQANENAARDLMHLKECQVSWDVQHVTETKPVTQLSLIAA